MVLPQAFLSKLQSLERREDQLSLGVEVCQDLLAGLKKIAPGAYLTSGGRKASVLADVLQAL